MRYQRAPLNSKEPNHSAQFNLYLKIRASNMILGQFLNLQDNGQDEQSSANIIPIQCRLQNKSVKRQRDQWTIGPITQRNYKRSDRIFTLINGKMDGLQLIIRMDDKNSNSGAQLLNVKGPYYSRVGHRAIRLNDQVLIFGGTGLSAEHTKNILRFNLEKQKIEPLQTPLCPLIEGFSLFTFKEKVFLWGGSLQNKTSNSLWVFQGASFELCSQKGDIPAPRSFHCSNIVSNKYLIVFGGFNQIETFSDWYMLDCQTLIWNRIQTNKQLTSRKKFQMVWHNGRGFLMSQYQVSKTGSKCSFNVKNELYELTIVSFTFFKLRIDFCQFQGLPLPPRFNFSLALLNNELWVLGGQIPILNNSEHVMSSEVWCYNRQNLQWYQKRFILTVKTCFQIINYKNKFYLLGGLKSTTEMSTVVEIFNYKDPNNITQLDSQVCGFCKNVFSCDQNSALEKINCPFKIEIKDQNDNFTQISTNFLSKLSRYLQNPIQAIGLLIDNSLNMGSSLICIYLKDPELNGNYFKKNQPYIYIGDNSKSFSSEEITKIIFSFRFKVEKYYRDHLDKEDVRMRNQYGLNLKFASLRLGNACLFVTNTIDDHIFVAYFSDVQTECPDGDPSFNCFYYLIDDKGKCTNNLNRQIIRENVKHLIKQEEFLTMENHFTKVYIFGIHDICSSENLYNKSDIVYSYAQGVVLHSLSDYVSKLYLNPFLGRQIFVEQSRISFTNLIAKFKQDDRNGLIQEVDTSSQLNIFSKIRLYRITSSAYPINFVYICHQNRLICTINSRGKLICGVLQVPTPIEVDFYRTKIQRWQEERKLIDYIHLKEQQWKRQRKGIEKCQQAEGRKIPAYLQF